MVLPILDWKIKFRVLQVTEGSSVVVAVSGLELEGENLLTEHLLPMLTSSSSAGGQPSAAISTTSSYETTELVHENTVRIDPDNKLPAHWRKRHVKKRKFYKNGNSAGLYNTDFSFRAIYFLSSPSHLTSLLIVIKCCSKSNCFF